MNRSHRLAHGLMYAMSFPDPELGEGLEEFLEMVDIRYYVEHLVSVAHNRRWFAGILMRQGRHLEAEEMLLAAADAEAQLLVVEGLLTVHCPDVEVV